MAKTSSFKQQPDFDEFDCLGRRASPLYWRDPLSASTADCKIFVNGDKEYALHLEVACRSSQYFFKVATVAGKSQPDQTPVIAGSCDTDGEIQVKMQDGATIRIGRITDMVSDLKTHIDKTLSISVSHQRLFYKGTKGADEELVEGWRTLANYGVKRGDVVMLVVRAPWQRTEIADVGDGHMRTVNLTLPEACVGVFEAVLDHMYEFHRDPRKEHALPELSTDSALAMLWLAGRLEMTELQEQVVKYLRKAVKEQNAIAFVAAAGRLGLVKVEAAAMKVAAAGLEGMAAGACDELSFEALERLLIMAEEDGRRSAGARDRVVTSYLRAYDGRGRLDEEAYCRLMRRHSVSALSGDGERAEGSVDKDVAGGEGIAAEDALLLLDMAIR